MKITNAEGVEGVIEIELASGIVLEIHGAGEHLTINAQRDTETQSFDIAVQGGELIVDGAPLREAIKHQNEWGSDWHLKEMERQLEDLLRVKTLLVVNRYPGSVVVSQANRELSVINKPCRGTTLEEAIEEMNAQTYHEFEQSKPQPAAPGQ